MLSEKRDVRIWIPQRGGLYRRTTTFELPVGQAKDRVDLCYKGSTHYDWFQPSDHELIAAFQQRLNHGQQAAPGGSAARGQREGAQVGSK
mmetsp:Transcript_30920/g.69840  ORF Transcript_30920/g.69840 Transcript_30920/m.69840 type:complete len:90 (-) Transcript_30920:273-542(-)